MTFTIQRAYATHATISYLDSVSNYSLKEEMCGTMDELTQHMFDVLVNHNFTYADACSSETGELLLIIKCS